MPSRSTIMAVVWSVATIAIISRVPQARVLVFGA